MECEQYSKLLQGYGESQTDLSPLATPTRYCSSEGFAKSGQIVTVRDYLCAVRNTRDKSDVIKGCFEREITLFNSRHIFQVAVRRACGRPELRVLRSDSVASGGPEGGPRAGPSLR